MISSREGFHGTCASLLVGFWLFVTAACSTDVPEILVLATEVTLSIATVDTWAQWRPRPDIVGTVLINHRETMIEPADTS